MLKLVNTLHKIYLSVCVHVCRRADMASCIHTIVYYATFNSREVSVYLKNEVTIRMPEIYAAWSERGGGRGGGGEERGEGGRRESDIEHTGHSVLV